jgi:hypothetical protein
VSDGTRLREEFLLDPSVTFLNHGSFGATPRAVFERYQQWQLELERQPVLFLARRLDALLAEGRAALGAYLGADEDDLVFVPNATAGVNVAAWPLGLGPGDEVLSTDLEYGALDLMWEHVCGDFGARYVRTPIRLPVTSADEIVALVWGGVGPRTRALFLSHHTSTTAMTLPVAELCRRAREAGIQTIVDGAHVPGHLPLNLRELDADYYAGNCHKWQVHLCEEQTCRGEPPSTVRLGLSSHTAEPYRSRHRRRTSPAPAFTSVPRARASGFGEDHERLGQDAVEVHRAGHFGRLHRSHESVHVGNVHKDSYPLGVLLVDECPDVGDAKGANHLFALW